MVRYTHHDHVSSTKTLLPYSNYMPNLHKPLNDIVGLAVCWYSILSTLDI